MLLVFTAIALGQPQGMERITVTGREMTGLHHRQNVIRGTCDGRPASATIIHTDRGRTGRLVLRGGRWTREVPPTFLNGSLVSNGLYHTGLACDGRRLQLSALSVRGDAHGDLVMDKQNAILDLRTGVLTLTDLRTLSAAETREELN